MLKPADLTEQEYLALKALKKISAGQTTFLNIPDADELVQKGLADRFGKGQYILTEEGQEIITKWGL